MFIQSQINFFLTVIRIYRMFFFLRKKKRPTIFALEIELKIINNISIIQTQTIKQFYFLNEKS
jgi:hypothetical protein